MKYRWGGKIQRFSFYMGGLEFFHYHGFIKKG